MYVCIHACFVCHAVYGCFICTLYIIYIYIYIYTYLCICIFVCVYVCQYVRLCAYMLVSIYMYWRTILLHKIFLINCLSCRYLRCYLLIRHSYLSNIIAFSFEFEKFLVSNSVSRDEKFQHGLCAKQLSEANYENFPLDKHFSVCNLTINLRCLVIIEKT